MQATRSVSIGVIGDFNAEFPPHAATNEALAHAGAALGMEVEARWLDTTPLQDIDMNEAGQPRRAVVRAWQPLQESCWRSSCGPLRARVRSAVHWDLRYYCNFGLNPEHQERLHEGGLLVSGIDQDGEARVLELPERRFYLATLFVPQLTSSPARPHPLITAYLQTAVHVVHANAA